jgi:predicted DNA-binding WGR domain protein
MTDLHLAVALVFRDLVRNSNKFHNSALIGRTIVVHFGRIHTAGQISQTEHPTVEKAHAAYWSLLRSKTAKGYRVLDATIGDLTASVRDPQNLSELDTHVIMTRWSATATARNNRHAITRVDGPEMLGLSPRTPKQGAAVIAALTDADSDADTLYACALADPSERFLYPLALSHPACPDEAKVAAALLRPEVRQTVPTF